MSIHIKEKKFYPYLTLEMYSVWTENLNMKEIFTVIRNNYEKIFTVLREGQISLKWHETTNHIKIKKNSSEEI